MGIPGYRGKMGLPGLDGRPGPKGDRGPRGQDCGFCPSGTCQHVSLTLRIRIGHILNNYSFIKTLTNNVSVSLIYLFTEGLRASI